MPDGPRALRRDDGATAVEYAVMTALIAVVIMMGVSTLGTNLQTVFAGVDSALDGDRIEPLPTAPTPPATPVAPITTAGADDDDAPSPDGDAQPTTPRGPGNNNASERGQERGQGHGGGG